MTGPRLPESSGRPQDTPRFPTYGRPQDEPVPPSGDQVPQYGDQVPQYRDQVPQYGDQVPQYGEQVPQYQGSPYQPPGSPYQPPGTSYQGQGSTYQPPGTSYQGQRSPYEVQPGPNPGAPQWSNLPPYPTPYGTPGYGYGYPGMLPVRTNGLAIAAMVTGLSSILFGVTAPVAVVLGIVALVQLRKSQEKGLAQAVVGLSVGAVVMLFWGLILALALLAGEDSGAFGGPDLPAPTSASVIIDDLTVGECFDETDDEAMVDRRPCTGPHDGELFGKIDLPAGAFPGDDESADRSEAACEKVFGGYVGIPIDDSELNMASWSPDEEAWEDGDRRALCAVYGPDEDKVTGTLKGSRR